MFLLNWRHGCIEKVRIAFRGGCLAETEQVAGMPMHRPGGGTGGGGNEWRQTDGWTVTKARTLGWEGGKSSETGLSQPKCETLLRG